MTIDAIDFATRDWAKAPATAAEIAFLEAHLSDPMWRLCNLYSIMIKGDDGETTLAVPFRPNEAQMQFVDRLHFRNLILKARQLGFTTLISILWLDHALFNANVRCGIIAQDIGAAEVIFRDKVKFAYDNLWPPLLDIFKLEKDSASELLFAHNNSSLRVATSMRSGTIHRLHVSEFGKICAKYPDKAREIVTGSFQAVPMTGITVVESTAEGQDGDFYKMVQRAQAHEDQGKKLTPRDYRLHFFPWWQDPRYALNDEDAAGVIFAENDKEAFHVLEAEIGHDLTLNQKAWYITVREADFSGDPSKMWAEYPGTVKEAFKVSIEGCYYSQQLATARKQGRICKVPAIEIPVNTWWDIGQSDYTSIWFHQQVGLEHRFIGFYEANNETLGHYVKKLQDTGHIFGHHYMPHDAAHKKLSDTNRSVEEMLEDLGLRNIEIVDRISDEQLGIQQTRKAFPVCWFDEEACALGIAHLAGFKKAWNKSLGCWRPEPEENDHIHAADAFRQFGQALESGQYLGSKKKGKPLRRVGSPWSR